MVNSFEKFSGIGLVLVSSFEHERIATEIKRIVKRDFKYFMKIR